MAELRTQLFTIEVAGIPRRAILLCSGQIGPHSPAALAEALSAAIATEAPVVEIDLRPVRGFDSGVAATLLQAHHELSHRGRALRLVANPRLSARLTGLGVIGTLSVRASGNPDLTRSPPDAEDAG